jgi:hypothetical protein
MSLKERWDIWFKVYPNETKTVRISKKRKENVMLSWRTIDDVETILYLDSVVTEEGVSAQDIKNCISKAHSSLIQLFKIWSPQQLSTSI